MHEQLWMLCMKHELMLLCHLWKMLQCHIIAEAPEAVMLCPGCCGSVAHLEVLMREDNEGASAPHLLMLPPASEQVAGNCLVCIWRLVNTGEQCL